MSSKKRILFLYNGGTIGQVPFKINGSYALAAPKDDKEFRNVCEPIIERFNEKVGIEAHFELVTTKDSTNMSPKDWEKLIFRIKKAQEVENYDGVGIAHGTDTMAYTASALALGLHGKVPGKSGLRIPVVITGSQTPVYEDGGDGEFNLENLFRVLKEAIDNNVADVLVNFWNRVLLGSRTLKVSEKSFDAFQSPAYPDVGDIDANGIHLNTELIHQRPKEKRPLKIAPKFGHGIVSLELSPGLDPNLVLGFVTNGGVAAMILKSLGEGNVCSEGPYNLIPFIEQATQEYETPILITTKFVAGGAGAAHYEVGLKAIDAGGIPCYDHTDVAVDVKTRWLIGNGVCTDTKGFRKAMKTSFAGEVKSRD